MIRKFTFPLQLVAILLLLMGCSKDNVLDGGTAIDPPSEAGSVITFPQVAVLNYTKATGHPIIFFDAANGAQLRTKIASGSGAALWARVKSGADAINATPPADRTDTGEQLWQRDVGNRIATLAMAAYLTKEQAYVTKGIRYALASGNYKTWGTDATSDGAEHGLAYGHQLLGIAMLYDYLTALKTEAVSTISVSEGDLATIKATLYNRTKRQYKSYTNLAPAYIQNHTWINCAGMLASALALRDDYPEETKVWIEFLHKSIFSVSAQMLSPDGASQEGPGYWQYGMEFLMKDFDMMKSVFGIDYYSQNDWWKNTGKWAAEMMTPYKFWYKDGTNVMNLVDFADSPRYSWYGPEELFYRLAALNNDAMLQWHAVECGKLTDTPSYLTILWYDPTITPAEGTQPLYTQFDNMGYVISHSDRSGEQDLVTFKCGAALGKYMNRIPSYVRSSSDMGHVHPDANHFTIFSNGEFIVRNNGYVKRESRYHNIVLVEEGYYGQGVGWYTPWPMIAAKDPYIKNVVNTDETLTVDGVASYSYVDNARVVNSTRKLMHIREAKMVIVYDNVETSTLKNIYQRTFPEASVAQMSVVSGTLITAQTSKNKARFENLTPDQADMGLWTEGVADRSTSTIFDRPVINIGRTTKNMSLVTAISWSDVSAEPNVATLKKSGDKLTIVVNGKGYDLK